MVDEIGAQLLRGEAEARLRLMRSAEAAIGDAFVAGDFVHPSFDHYGAVGGGAGRGAEAQEAGARAQEARARAQEAKTKETVGKAGAGAKTAGKGGAGAETAGNERGNCAWSLGRDLALIMHWLCIYNVGVDSPSVSFGRGLIFPSCTVVNNCYA